MCTNYRAGSRDFIRRAFGCDASFDYEEEAYPAYRAPIVRAGGDGAQCVAACFGLVAHWSRDTRIARSTYNARAETVADKPSFRRAWRQCQFCLVPMRAFYEPCYESGRAVRWCVEAADGREFAVAGIWESWQPPTATAWAGAPELVSFSMLTINADGHPLMQRFHAPGDEKRSIVVIEPGAYQEWLRADSTSARALLRGPDAQAYVAHAAPRVRTPAARRPAQVDSNLPATNLNDLRS